MTFKVFGIETDPNDKNRERLEHDLNAFETELDNNDLQINHILTTPTKWVKDNKVFLIVQYGPKPKEVIIGTESI
jgi:poly(3-hydroxyalkanoate) synthetase